MICHDPIYHPMICHWLSHNSSNMFQSSLVASLTSISRSFTIKHRYVQYFTLYSLLYSWTLAKWHKRLGLNSICNLHKHTIGILLLALHFSRKKSIWKQNEYHTNSDRKCSDTKPAFLNIQYLLYCLVGITCYPDCDLDSQNDAI